MGNSVSVDSYLNHDTCGGRNITWAYLSTNGSLPLPAPYDTCSNVARVLKSHCCEEGSCRPAGLDAEFTRYEWYDWSGLGKPYVEGDGKVRWGAKKNGKKCKPPLLRRALSGPRDGEGLELAQPLERPPTLATSPNGGHGSAMPSVATMVVLVLLVSLLGALGLVFWVCKKERMRARKDRARKGKGKGRKLSVIFEEDEEELTAEEEVLLHLVEGDQVRLEKTGLGSLY